MKAGFKKKLFWNPNSSICRKDVLQKWKKVKYFLRILLTGTSMKDLRFFYTEVQTHKRACIHVWVGVYKPFEYLVYLNSKQNVNTSWAVISGSSELNEWSIRCKSEIITQKKNIDFLSLPDATKDKLANVTKHYYYNTFMIICCSWITTIPVSQRAS